jgi:Fur family ferric uptake transcriptional regulator
MVTVTRNAWVDSTERLLRDAGHRASAPRAAILELLGQQRCLLTAREMTDQLRAQGRDVGTATVYRALELLHSLGAVERVDTGEGFARYEPADPSGAHHHHHLLCAHCGQVSPFEDERLEQAIDELSERLAYRVEGHDVVLRGICPDCG